MFVHKGSRVSCIRVHKCLSLGSPNCVCELAVIKCGHVCRSDAWVGEFQKASTGLSTNEEAKRSANAIFQVELLLMFSDMLKTSEMLETRILWCSMGP